MVAGCAEPTIEYGDEELREMLVKMERRSLSLRDRVAQVAELTGCPRKRVYQIALKGKFS